ncbi:MAG: hypothetical protein JNM28_00975 [Armatimonadetes bacterium]|nr:hypothetical protein [Armatimonadota bacterium]
MLTRLFALLAAVVVVCPAFAQFPEKNPLVKAVQAFGEKGLGGQTDLNGNLVFKSTGNRIYIDEYLKIYDDSKELKEAIKQVIEEGIKGYEDEAKNQKMENDGAAAYAVAALTVYSLTQKGEMEIGDEAILATTGQIRYALKSVKATDREKQEFYEWSLSVCFSTVGIYAALADGDSKDQLPALVAAQFAVLTGAMPDQATFKGGKLTIAGKPKSGGGAEASKGGLAEGFSYSLPSGWTENSGWLVGAKPYYSEMMAASVRLLPAIPASSDLGASLRKLWAENVPAGLKDRGTGMVFRRYVGDGVPAFFMFGRGPEDGVKWDALYSLYIVDCGPYWQPLIIAQTYWDPNSQYPVGASMTAGLTFSSSAPIGEEFLAGIRCPYTKGAALIDREAMVGDYWFGSGASQQWVNVFTGSTSMTFVSYGGSLFLKPDGKFEYTFSSASGAVGATTFRGAKGAGTWSLKGDLLTCHWTSYDQGDGYKPKDYVYRVTGVVVFPDGERVVVLEDDLNVPVNAVTVGDSSNFFSTRKK